MRSKTVNFCVLDVIKSLLVNIKRMFMHIMGPLHALKSSCLAPSPCAFDRTYRGTRSPTLSTPTPNVTTGRNKRSHKLDTDNPGELSLVLINGHKLALIMLPGREEL